MGAAVAMRADIDHEGARLDVDFVGADEEGHVQRAGFGHRGGVEAALARDKADIERADAGGGGVQDRKTGPVALRRAELRGQRQNGGAVLARQRALPDQDQRTLGLGQDFAEAFAGGDLGQRVRPGAEVIVGIGQVEPFADQRRSGNGRCASGGGCAR